VAFVSMGACGSVVISRSWSGLTNGSIGPNGLLDRLGDLAGVRYENWMIAG
jgi:hypothetical protein